MRFVARRFAHVALLLLAISFLSFALLQLAPGDFLSSLRMNPRISPQTIAALQAQYGLEQPLPERYAHWLQSALHGEIGFSLAYHVPVGPLVWNRACKTLLLAVTATLAAWLLALPLGIWTAARKDEWPDRLGGFLTSALITVPDLLLFLGLLLFAVRTGWLPSGGMRSLASSGAGLWPRAKDIALHLILPAGGLALLLMPMLLRHVRSAMIEALGSPALRAARAHGIPRRRLLLRYALPEAANPLISLLGFSIGTMLSTSLVAEVVLSWPGLGPLLIEAILARDTYLVTGIVLLSAVFLVGGNLFADLLLFACDPRIRAEARL